MSTSEPCRAQTSLQVLRHVVAAFALVGASACGEPQASAAQASLERTRAVVYARTPDRGTRAALSADERLFYREMARDSWAYLNAQEQSATGLVSATADWPHTTLWDVGGQLLAFHAAKELGLLSAAEYDRRTRKTLTTLEHLPLYAGVAFSKVYSTRTGAFGDGTHGWSATDLGRLLVALRILTVREPSHAAQSARIVRRIAFSTIVTGGYLHGQMLGANAKPRRFQEGRIGYEQYAAAGFAFWGAQVGNASNVMKHAQPITVLGVPLLQDARGDDRLLSEPFILYGLELGLAGTYRDLAVNVLNAQRARFDSTGAMTMATEDAVDVAPDFFYYYCVYCGRTAFGIGVAANAITHDGPRWVSTKAAFGWQAVLPDDYTRRAVAFVSPALDRTRGWSSGVFEGTRASTNSYDVNTAAVLMEVAFFQLRGGVPLLLAARSPLK